VRDRENSGRGADIRIALEDVALATAGNLGLLTEPQVSGTQRPRLGNAIFGQYGQDFTTGDGVTFMVVMLTRRHFRDMVAISGTGKAISALAEALGADFTDEGTRYRYRDVLSGLFATWFAENTAEHVSATLAGSTILWEQYRSFAEVAGHQKVTANPLFARVEQQGVGSYLAPGLPIAFDGTHPAGAPAPQLGADTVALLGGLGIDADEIGRLTAAGTIAPQDGP
jgi:2-methylfumaryl-CoA isomerase